MESPIGLQFAFERVIDQWREDEGTPEELMEAIGNEEQGRAGEEAALIEALRNAFTWCRAGASLDHDLLDWQEELRQRVFGRDDERRERKARLLARSLYDSPHAPQRPTSEWGMECLTVTLPAIIEILRPAPESVAAQLRRVHAFATGTSVIPNGGSLSEGEYGFETTHGFDRFPAVASAVRFHVIAKLTFAIGEYYMNRTMDSRTANLLGALTALDGELKKEIQQRLGVTEGVEEEAH